MALPNYTNKWRKISRLDWVNAYYPTWKIQKRESSRYTLKHYRLTESEKLVKDFRNVQDAKKYAEDVIRQSAVRSIV
jgi:hypothetical protein